MQTNSFAESLFQPLSPERHPREIFPETGDSEALINEHSRNVIFRCRLIFVFPGTKNAIPELWDGSL